MNHQEGTKRRFAPEEIAEVWERLRAGQSFRSVAKGLGRYPNAVRQLIQRSGGVPPLMVKSRRPRFLSIWEREEISRALQMGAGIRSIAAQLGRSPSTISREIRRNTFVGEYDSLRAEESAALRARRLKPAKVAITPALRAVVEEKLEPCWSPQQISAWLRIHYPGDKEMHVSHEKIYMSLFVQGRGALRRELHRNLRTHRALGRRQIPKPFAGQGHISNMVNISRRPVEIEDRAIPGHWEGDLIIGRGKTAIGTLVERNTRYVMLFGLEKLTAENVRIEMTQKISR